MIKSIRLNKKVLLLIVLLITALSYVNIIENDFIHDDYNFVVDWPLIRNVANFPQFFGPQNQPPGEEGVYSPLKTLIHSINYNLFGLNPLGHHLFSIIVHLLGTFFAYKIAKKISGSFNIAILCALFFGLHPVHVEAIASITGSVDTLGAVFALISFYYYLKTKAQKRARLNYTVSFICAVIAIFTHELLIILPLFILLYEICFCPTEIKKNRTFVLLLFLISLFYAFLKQVILGAVARGGYVYDSIYLTALIVVKALAKYVLILLFPFKLSLNHEISKGIYSVDWQDFDKTSVLSQSMFDVQVILSIVLIAFMGYWLIKNYKKEPLISFCIGWFFVSLLPVMNIIPSGSFFAERYLYPGSFAFCLALAYLFEKLKKQFADKVIYSKGLNVLLIVVICFYFAKTVIRNTNWRDMHSFLLAEVRANPNNALMRRDLALAYKEAGRFDEAISHFNDAILIRPYDEELLFLIADTYAQQKNFNKAIHSYLKSIEINQKFADSYLNLAGIYFYLGKYTDGRIYFDKGIELLQKKGRFKEAEEIKKGFEKYLSENQGGY